MHVCNTAAKCAFVQQMVFLGLGTVRGAHKV